MIRRGIHIVYAIGVAVAAAPVYAVPVVPNFTQGSMTSTTTQTITTSETINSMGLCDRLDVLGNGSWRRSRRGNYNIT